MLLCPEHVLEAKVEFGIGFQPSLKVSSQVWLSPTFHPGVPKDGGNGEINSIASS